MKQIIPFAKDLELGTKITEITSIALEHNLQMENEDSVVGNFVVSGKYKINDISINEEVFEKVLPFDITLDDKYDASKVQIDIDDFYYEIINDEYLRVHIDVLVDNLVYVKEIRPLEEEKKKDDEKVLIEEVPVVIETLKIPDEEENIRKDGDDNIMNNEVEKRMCVVNENVVENTKSIEETKNDEITIATGVTEDALISEVKEGREEVSITNNLSSSFFSEEEKYIMYKVHIVRENETIDQIKEKYEVTKEELEKYNNLENIVLGTKIIIPVSNE